MPYLGGRSAPCGLPRFVLHSLAVGQPVNAFLSWLLVFLIVQRSKRPTDAGLCRIGGAPAARLAALQRHGRRPSIVKAGAKRRGEGSEATGGQAVFAAQSGSFFDVVHNGGLSNY
jgi:hypothetical protein